jgi:hypothetical protein
MLEYLFFSDSVTQRFRDFLAKQDVAYEDRVEKVENARIIALNKPEDEDLWDLIEDYYDQLAIEDQELAEAQEAQDTIHRAGIFLQLSGGRQTNAMVDPDILNRILSAVTMDELHLFLEAVVRSVENPDDSPICHTEAPDEH